MSYQEIDHTEILDFLEYNITELARLRVASPAKYRHYEGTMLNYINADFNEDRESAELYREELDRCYTWTRHKLKKAVSKNGFLLMNELVVEYLSLFSDEY